MSAGEPTALSVSAGEPTATTTVVRTGWRARFDPRPALMRLLDSLPAIAQLVIAATGAFAIANLGLGHTTPLVAATVTISSLGLARDARPARVFETLMGMVVGVFLAEVVLLWWGSGWWQIGITLAATLIITRTISAQASFSIAAAVQSLIVMVMPPMAPGLKLLDAAIGGAVALVVTALIPRSPMRHAVSDGSALLASYQSALVTVIQALNRGDKGRAERALEKSRALQGPLDRWRGSVEAGVAIARISPFLRRQRSELARQHKMLEGLDLATRNLRVIARRCVYLTADGRPRPVAADLLTQLRQGVSLLALSLDDISQQPVARSAFVAVASRLDPAQWNDGAADHNLIIAMRPLAVDLLLATGMDADDARAALPRV